MTINTALLSLLLLAASQGSSVPTPSSVPVRPAITLERMQSTVHGLRFLLEEDEEYIHQLQAVIEKQAKELAELREKLAKPEEKPKD